MDGGARQLESVARTCCGNAWCHGPMRTLSISEPCPVCEPARHGRRQVVVEGMTRDAVRVVRRLPRRRHRIGDEDGPAVRRPQGPEQSVLRLPGT